MKNRIFATISALFFILGLTFVPQTHADCVPIYGGGESCTNPNLTIVKTVFNPGSNSYVHDMGLNDTRFHPGDKVSFQVTITNTGDGRATHVVITDFLPSSLLAVAPNPDSTTGPAGATITLQSSDLNPGQSATFTVVGQVSDSLPQSVLCQSNKAQVVSSEDSNVATDFSQFCVEQVAPTSTNVAPTAGVTVVPTVFPPSPTTSLPPTGPESLPLLALFPTGLTGIVLRSFAKKLKGGEKV